MPAKPSTIDNSNSQHLSPDEIDNVSYASNAFKTTFWAALVQLGWVRSSKSANPLFVPPSLNGTPGRGVYGTKRMVKFVQSHPHWGQHASVLSSIIAYRREYA